MLLFDRVKSEKRVIKKRRVKSEKFFMFASLNSSLGNTFHVILRHKVP